MELASRVLDWPSPWARARVPAGNVFDQMFEHAPGRAAYCPSIRIQVVFNSVYLSNACSDLSRPLPLCL